MKTLIILGASAEACHIIRRVKELGIRTVVVDGNPNAPGIDFADCFLVASCYHADEAIHVLHNAITKWYEHYDGVLCAAVDAPHVAAAIRNAFGLPGMNVEIAWVSVDKYAQKRKLERSNIPIPMFLGCYGDCIPLGEWGIVKPCDSRGARGVTRLLPSVDPAQAYAEAKAYSPTGRVMVEEWLDGPQINSESILQDGKILFTALSWRNYARLEEFAPYVVEDGLDMIHNDPALLARINVLLEDTCRALNWGQDYGMTVKGDIILHDGKLYILELAARLSGGYYATYSIPMAFGVPFVDYAIQFALGKRTDKIDGIYKPVYLSQRYVFPEPSDIGKQIVSLPENADANFIAWHFRPGDVIRPVTSHPDRFGMAICTGATVTEARERAEQAVAEMKRGMALK